MTDCVFCKIIAGEIPSRKLYEDDHVMAFLDAFPAVKGHVLVVPKQHASNLLEGDEADAVMLMKTVRHITPKITEALGADGVNIMSNIGEVAGQSVFHTHVHILPRFKGDGKQHWGPLDPAPDLSALYTELKKKL